MKIFFLISKVNIKSCKKFSTYLVTLVLPNMLEIIFFCGWFDMVEYSMRLALALTYLIVVTFWILLLLPSTSTMKMTLFNFYAPNMFLFFLLENFNLTLLLHSFVVVEIYPICWFDDALKIEKRTMLMLNVKRKRKREEENQRIECVYIRYSAHHLTTIIIE